MSNENVGKSFYWVSTYRSFNMLNIDGYKPGIFQYPVTPTLNLSPNAPAYHISHAFSTSAASASLSCLSISAANRFFSAFFSRIIVISSRLGLFAPSPLPNGEPLLGVLKAAGEKDANDGFFLMPSLSSCGEAAGVDDWVCGPENVKGSYYARLE